MMTTTSRFLEMAIEKCTCIPGSETLLYFIACNAMKYYPLSKNEILFWRRAAVT